MAVQPTSKRRWFRTERTTPQKPSPPKTFVHRTTSAKATQEETQERFAHEGQMPIETEASEELLARDPLWEVSERRDVRPVPHRRVIFFVLLFLFIFLFGSPIGGAWMLSFSTILVFGFIALLVTRSIGTSTNHTTVQARITNNDPNITLYPRSVLANLFANRNTYTGFGYGIHFTYTERNTPYQPYGIFVPHVSEDIILPEELQAHGRTYTLDRHPSLLHRLRYTHHGTPHPEDISPLLQQVAAHHAEER